MSDADLFTEYNRIIGANMDYFTGDDIILKKRP